MISDKETNTIFISNLLHDSHPIFLDQFNIILGSFGIHPLFLEKTKDIWARDYMPIQISKKTFIEFRYDPDYLQGTERTRRGIKSYPDIICAESCIKTKKSDIILDGGNVVKSSNCVIMTDKVVFENKHSYSKTELIKQLKTTLEVDRIVLIPQDPNDKFGHSDGMVRFIDNNTVLLAHYYKNDKRLIKILSDNGLRPIPLIFNTTKPDKNCWAYINFLQMNDFLIIPKLRSSEDKEALSQIKSAYKLKDNSIKQIEMPTIIKKGGALNCISWTIKQ